MKRFSITGSVCVWLLSVGCSLEPDLQIEEWKNQESSEPRPVVVARVPEAAVGQTKAGTLKNGPPSADSNSEVHPVSAVPLEEGREKARKGGREKGTGPFN